MSKEYFVYVSSADYLEVEADDEEEAKAVAKEIFLANPSVFGVNAEIIRVTEYKNPVPSSDNNLPPLDNNLPSTEVN